MVDAAHLLRIHVRVLPAFLPAYSRMPIKRRCELGCYRGAGKYYRAFSKKLSPAHCALLEKVFSQFSVLL